MPLHTPQEATLGGFKGNGYAFTKRSFHGKKFHGVFFPSEEDQTDLEALLDKEEVHFKGIVYNKLKSGKITKKMQSFVVDVKHLLTVRAGKRLDFDVLDAA